MLLPPRGLRVFAAARQNPTTGRIFQNISHLSSLSPREDLMTATLAKLAANRANAMKSTGPRTERGKRRSSMNGVTHGMFCREIVLPDEDAGEFERFRIAVLRRLSPQDVVELMLCDRIVE